jgi:hypothetical protein
MANRQPPPPTADPSPLSADEAQGVGEAALRAAIASLSLEPEPPQIAQAEAVLAETLAETTPARVEDIIAVAMAAWRASNLPVPPHAEAALTAALTGRTQTDDAGAPLSAAEIQARHDIVARDLATGSDFSDRKRATMRDKLRHEPLVSYNNPVRRQFSLNNVGIEVDAGPVDVPTTVLEHLLQFNAYEGYADTYRAALKLSGEDVSHEIKRQNVTHDLMYVLPPIPDLRGLEINGGVRPSVRIR